MVFISGGWLCSWESKAELDAAVRGGSDAKSMEQGTSGTGERQDKGGTGLPVEWRPTGVSCCQHLLQLVQKLQSSHYFFKPSANCSDEHHGKGREERRTMCRQSPWSTHSAPGQRYNICPCKAARAGVSVGQPLAGMSVSCSGGVTASGAVCQGKDVLGLGSDGTSLKGDISGGAAVQLTAPPAPLINVPREGRCILTWQVRMAYCPLNETSPSQGQDRAPTPSACRAPEAWCGAGTPAR